MKQGYLKKIETFQINNLTLHLHELEEQQQTSSGVSRQKEMTKVRAELNDVGTKRTTQRINKSKRWLSEKINETNNPLSRHMKKRRERAQINKIRNERGENIAVWNIWETTVLEQQ